MMNLLQLFSNATSNMFDNLLQSENINGKNSQWILFAKDCSGKYIGGSDTYISISGFNKPEDIIGLRDIELCWAKEAAETIKHDQIVIQSKSPKMFVEYGTGIDGYLHKALSQKFPLYSRTKKIIGVICLAFLTNHRNQHTLTPRQLECVRCISKGFTIKETAAFLMISPRTVETYINQAKIMFSAKNVVELIAMLVKQKII